MTRAEYMACIRDLCREMRAAKRSGDQDRILGTEMATEAFLSVVRVPPEDEGDLSPTRQDPPTT